MNDETTLTLAVTDSDGTVLDTFEVIVPTEHIQGWNDPKVARLAVTNVADDIRFGIL